MFYFCGEATYKHGIFEFTAVTPFIVQFFRYLLLIAKGVLLDGLRPGL